MMTEAQKDRKPDTGDWKVAPTRTESNPPPVLRATSPKGGQKHNIGYNKPILKHTRELSKGKVPSLLGLFSKLFK